MPVEVVYFFEYGLSFGEFMATAKEVFKRNFLSVARAQGVTSGTALSKIAAGLSDKGIEKTYCNSLLKESDEPINLSLDKAEAVSLALKVPIYDMLNPAFNYGAKKNTKFDLAMLAESIRMVRHISEREGISNADFESALASYLYFAKENDVPEVERYAEMARIIRDFMKHN